MLTLHRFYDIAWGPPDEDHPRGIIAGAYENGTLELWDAEKLISGTSPASIGTASKHSGAIKSIQFNPLKPNILATAGDKGELFVYDVNDISSPFRLGPVPGRADDLECLAWNRKVSHILASGGASRYVTVWDLKTKKASLNLNTQCKATSAIAWDPNNSTKLLTASPDDSDPVICLWDLRNSNAAEKKLQGHEQGVLSLSWCQQDSDLLLSGAKDNKAILWNPQTGEKYGDFPEVTSWIFSTRFNPHNPNLLASAALDGKITVQTLQNTNPSTSQVAAQSNLDDEDFFTSAQTQPQDASFSLTKAPKWMERPIGASFGFGGKLVAFKKTSAPGQKGSSKVLVSPFSVDTELGSATEIFEKSLGSGDFVAICEANVDRATTEEEKADWRVMGTLAGDNARQRIVEYLGFKQEEATNGVATDDGETGTKSGSENGDKAKPSGMFSEEPDGDGDDFFSKGGPPDEAFHILGEDDGVDADITKAIMLGNFAKATTLCLKEDRMADAFLIANCGGQDLVDKVQTAYLSRKSGSPSYLRLLGSVIGKNLWDVVKNADLSNWKEAMAVLCTFSSPGEFPGLCEALGDRIMEQGERKDASFCYLVGSKLEKVVSIWISELGEAEQAGVTETAEGSSFSVHVKTLQYFIEKVTVFRHVTKFEDSEKSLNSGWKLAPLYDKYTEYADIIAADGQLQTAQKYLDLLPGEYPPAEISRERVKLATKKAAPKAATKQPAAGARTSSRAQPMMGYQPPQPVQMPSMASPANQFAAATQPSQASAANPYAPPSSAPYGAPASSPYAPTQGYQPPAQPGYPSQAQGYQPPTTQPGYGGATGYGPPPGSFGGPPRNTTPSVPPPSRAKDMDNWNDVPLVARSKPAPRRATPSMTPSPFTPQASQTGPPPSAPPQSPHGRTGSTPPPPPPKGPAPPRVTSPLAGPPQSSHPPRPTSSSAGNAYAPPSQPGTMPPPMQQAIPRVASPYAAPPAPGGPPSNKYAPAPAAQTAPAMAPPPTSIYGAPPQQGPPKSSYAPAPYQAAPQQSKPPTGPPPMGLPPSSGPPPAARAQPTPPPPRAAAAPPKAKLPPGDRSQIPANAQRLIDILTRDMQRVAARAPSNFAPQVKDTQKRLGLLFDHLNNGELVQPATIEELSRLAEAIEAKDYAQATSIQVSIQTNKTEECGNWMVRTPHYT